MDRAGVKTAIVSITTPGVGASADGLGGHVARACNEYAASLVADFPGRFGFFAAVPLPDIDDSLAEIEYAFEHLGADGVCLFTSYDTQWLGHAAFDPVLAELDRRAAVVYTHPTASPSCRSVLPGIKDAIIEYGADTTRAIANLIISRIPDRFPNVAWIFSHGGGVLPMVHERLLRVVESEHGLSRRSTEAQLKQFFYDIAQVANPIAMSALSRMTQPSQLLWGTDFPYRSAEEYVHQLSDAGFSSSDQRLIETKNALRLLPHSGDPSRRRPALCS